MAQNKTSADRGIFLTILLVLSVIGFIWRLFITFGGGLAGVTYVNPPPFWYRSFEIIANWVSVLSLGGAIFGLFKWKKWGVYLLALSLVVDIVYHLAMFIFADWYTGSARAVGGVIVAGLWFCAISRKWQNFS